MLIMDVFTKQILNCSSYWLLSGWKEFRGTSSKNFTETIQHRDPCVQKLESEGKPIKPTPSEKQYLASGSCVK